MKFEKLINSIKDTSQCFQSNAVKAINLNLTLRNWMVGYYIFEFEQKGEDRAEYGSKILPSIAKKIDLKGLAETNLKICRQFYICYPLLLKIALQNNKEILPSSIRQSLTDELQINNNQELTISQSVTDELGNQDDSYLYNLLITTSFTHFVELIKIEDATKRRFFE
ncbi:MAG: cytoplasmic protein, partial [Oligoflexus sp.]|nr:cytoplasmic protein [Pseudopedobacter sp.]